MTTAHLWRSRSTARRSRGRSDRIKGVGFRGRPRSLMADGSGTDYSRRVHARMPSRLGRQSLKDSDVMLLVVIGGHCNYWQLCRVSEAANLPHVRN